MRSILSKLVGVSMIAGAGLLVTACNSETTATVNNTTPEEVVPIENGVSDDMVTSVDGATDNGTVVNVTTPEPAETGAANAN